MSEVNPYAAPAEWDPADANDGVPMAELVDDAGRAIGMWRRGRVLIMHRHAHLPHRCVKTNRPTAPDERWRHTFTWCHPAVFLGLLVNLLLLLILYLIFRKKATIELGVNRARLVRRRRALLGGWLLFLAGFVGFIGFCVVSADAGPEASTTLGLVAVGWLVAGLCGLIWAAWGSYIVGVKRIDAHYVWLGGVHPDYLAVLPEWPGK